MFDVGQAVLVITSHGTAYEGHVKARAMGDSGAAPAYLIESTIGGQQDQWHRSSDIFLPEAIRIEDPDSIEAYLKK